MEKCAQGREIYKHACMYKKSDSLTEGHNYPIYWMNWIDKYIDEIPNGIYSILVNFTQNKPLSLNDLEKIEDFIKKFKDQIDFNIIYKLETKIEIEKERKERKEKKYYK